MCGTRLRLCEKYKNFLTRFVKCWCVRIYLSVGGRQPTVEDEICRVLGLIKH